MDKQFKLLKLNHLKLVVNFEIRKLTTKYNIPDTYSFLHYYFTHSLLFFIVFRMKETCQVRFNISDHGILNTKIYQII